MINIELMTKEDVKQVAEIEKEIFSVPWSEKSFEESLQNINTLYVVAKEEQRVVGYCGMYISFNEADISNVAVAKEYRRQKIAKQMLEYIIGKAKEISVTDLTLEVRETNVPAIKLYEQIGFKEAGIRKDFYDKPLENALIMWKHNL